MQMDPNIPVIGKKEKRFDSTTKKRSSHSLNYFWQHGIGRLEYVNGCVYNGIFEDDFEKEWIPDSLKIGEPRFDFTDLIGAQDQSGIFSESDVVSHVLLRNNGRVSPTTFPLFSGTNTFVYRRFATTSLLLLCIIVCREAGRLHPSDTRGVLDVREGLWTP